MKRVLKIAAVAMVFVLASCAGAKSYTKKGNKYAQADLNDQAVIMYLRALDKKPEYVNALIGLKTASQKVVSEYQTKLFKANAAGDLKTYIYTYLEMVEFVEKVNKYNAKIEIPSHYANDYKRNKNKYLEQRFEEANNQLSDENFKKAEEIFSEIKSLDPAYKGGDLKELLEIAKLEPLYRKGNDYFAKNKYRAAYYKFRKVTRTNASYKDAKIRMDESLELAKYPIAVMRFQNYANERGAHEKISSEIVSNIINRKNPFIQLIDRQNINAILKEQKMSLEGEVSSTTAAKAGELIGAKAVLTGHLLEVTKIHKAPTPVSRKAYEAYVVKKYNPQSKKYYNETKYRKVYYTSFSGYNKVMVSFKFQLISSETGEILLSQIVSKEETSKVEYAHYNGNYKDLVPGDWKFQHQHHHSDRVSHSRSARRQLMEQFTAPRSATPVQLIAPKLYPRVGEAVALKLIRFNPENR